MIMKFFAGIMMLVILYCLGSGLFFLIREKPGSTRMVKALTWRIVLSFCLFLMMLVAYFLGWVTPHGIVPS